MFIQKLSGDELLEFNQRVLMGMREGDDSASTTIPQDIETINTGIIYFLNYYRHLSFIAFLKWSYSKKKYFLF